MKFMPQALALLATASSLALPGATVVELREDFSEPTVGAWDEFFVPLARLADGETVRTPLSDGDNDSIGPWGGHYPVGGMTQGGLFVSGATLPGVLTSKGSLFGVNDPDALGNGFVVFGAYPTLPDVTIQDESGGYLYTAFPATPIDLTGGGSIQFDAFNGSVQDSASIEMRVMLRVDDAGTPLWILSEPFPLTSVPKVMPSSPPPGGTSFTDGPTVNLDPSTLQWTEITAPSDANLSALLSGDDAALTLGSAVPSPSFSEVTGFGLRLETDIVRDVDHAYGVGVDAIRLVTASSPVQQWSLYR